MCRLSHILPAALYVLLQAEATKRKKNIELLKCYVLVEVKKRWCKNSEVRHQVCPLGEQTNNHYYIERCPLALADLISHDLNHNTVCIRGPYGLFARSTVHHCLLWWRQAKLEQRRRLFWWHTSSANQHIYHSFAYEVRREGEKTRCKAIYRSSLSLRLYSIQGQHANKTQRTKLHFKNVPWHRLL